MYDIIIFGFVILLLDIPMLKYIIGPKYNKMGMGLEPVLVAALCAYTAMILSWFVIEGDMLKGALVGFAIYGTYAFTLLTILPSYDLSLGLTETLWGTFLFTVATFATKCLKK
jgi:uncharacterized membrane protein